MAFESANTPVPLPPSDPNGPHFSLSTFDFLLIELVPLAYRLAASAAERDAAFARPTARKGKSTDGNASANASTVAKSTGTAAVASGLGVGGIGGSVAGADEEEMRESVFWRLDAIGYRVGLGLVDRFARDKPRFNDTLDVIKFICKDLWMLVFRKQIDNLKTNHRGVYVLTDNSFKPLSKISLEPGRDNIMVQAQPFLYFPAGVIRGALASMGIVANVTAESGELPGATFQIRTVGSKA